MIKSLIIKNFETHLDTFIELHSGVNTFIGDSDEGKSGMVRSIEWNAENRPLGDSYRNDELDPKKDKKVKTSVQVNYDTGTVKRERDGVTGGINHYIINDQEPLRALRSDVPQEVREVSKMKKVNIQGQHPTEQYFLLADKPGQVAKAFNKVAGLSIMDKATTEINAQIRTCNTKITIAKNEIETKEEEIKETKWVDNAKKLALKLKKLKSLLVKKIKEKDKLIVIIFSFKNIDEKLKSSSGIEQGLKDLVHLEKAKKNLASKEKQISRINDTVAAIKSNNLTLSDTNDTTEALTALKSLEKQRTEIKRTAIKIKSIKTKIEEIKEIGNKITIAEEDHKDHLKEFETMIENETCPTCGRNADG